MSRYKRFRNKRPSRNCDSSATRIRRILYALTGLAVMGFIAAPAAAHASPSPAAHDTTNFDYWCSNNYTGHFACDFYPSDSGNDFGLEGNVGSPSNPYAWPGYTLRYNSTNLMLSNGSNGCLHISKQPDNADFMNIATCNHGDKNQRWSFPNGGLEIKASGDDACVNLTFNAVTGFVDGYNMQTCNASADDQNWKWFSPGNAPVRLTAAYAPANNPNGHLQDVQSQVSTEDWIGVNSSGVLVGASTSGLAIFGTSLLGGGLFQWVFSNPGGKFNGDCVFFDQNAARYDLKGCNVRSHADLWLSTSSNTYSQLFDVYQGSGLTIVFAGVGHQITWGPANGTNPAQHWHWNGD